MGMLAASSLVRELMLNRLSGGHIEALQREDKINRVCLQFEFLLQTTRIHVI